MKLFKILILFFIGFYFTACGYKPTSSYVNKELGEKIFVDVSIDLKDPRNTVLIKDSLNEILVHKLGKKLIYDKNSADTIMNLKLQSVSLKVLQDDENGYNKVYKAIVKIVVNYKNSNKSEKFSVTGDYDFSIDSGTTITDTRRYEAIKSAANAALEDIISIIAIKSF